MEKFHMHHEFYISTGALDARYTLRHARMSAGFFVDRYVRNLADSEELALSKAMVIFENFRERVESENCSVVFAGFETDGLRQRRGKLSVRDTEALNMIERGMFPFGKFKGHPVGTADDGYIMYWVDQGEKAPSIVALALSSACMDIAIERDLIKKREIAKAARAEQDMKSNHIGTIGERRVFEGEVVSVFKLSREYEALLYVNKIRVGNDLIDYFGRELAPRGSKVKFKATIKRHSEYKGVKSTVVNRPANVEIQE